MDGRGKSGQYHNMISPFFEHNPLMKTGSGVWVLEKGGNTHEVKEGFPFDRLRTIFENSKDLTSTSIELEKTYANWDFESEFHLSPRRANLLRGLNLSG